MLIIKKIKKLPSGEYEATWNLSAEETSYLLSYAINSLINEGIVTVENKFEQEVDIERDEKRYQLDFLAAIPTEFIGKA